MAIEDKFKSQTYSIYDYLSNAAYGFFVPIYQRGYSWEEQKVADLVVDIVSGVHAIYERNQIENYTYIGTLITTDGQESARTAGSRNFPDHVMALVDGQQRISTITLLALAILIAFDESSQKVEGHFNDSQDEAIKSILDWLNQQRTFLERMLRFEFAGTSNKAPKLIKAFSDRWLVGADSYQSPIPFMVSSYFHFRGQGRVRNFSPQNPPNWSNRTNHEKKRFADISRTIQYELAGNAINDQDKDWFSSLPNFDTIFNNVEANRHFLNRQIPRISGDHQELYSRLIPLLVFNHYFLHRVAITVVRGMSEDIAFEVFESLNTSGEPLNAFETFKPGVIRLIPADQYPGSREENYFNKLDLVLSRPSTIPKKQRLVSDTLINFALAHSGETISKSLSNQVQFFKNSFTVAGLDGDSSRRHEYLHLLWNTAEIVYIFTEKRFTNHGVFIELIQSDDEVLMCCQFLAEIRHTITYPLISRFYSDYLESSELQRDDRCSAQEIRTVIKAITAFSVLWRTAWGGTAGIDAIYRNLMGRVINPHHLTYSKVTSQNRKISAQELRDTLKNILFTSRLGRRDSLESKSKWRNQSRSQPIYSQQHVCKFLLLAAQHDSIPDEGDPGLIRKGARRSHVFFTHENFSNTRYWIEHIAPRTPVAGQWEPNIYEDPNVKDRLGNLVVMPDVDNIISSNHSWSIKKNIYQALSMTNKEDRLRMIKASGLVLSEHQTKLLLDAEVQPTLASIIQRDHWDLDFVNRRTDRLLDLAYDRLIAWL